MTNIFDYLQWRGDLLLEKIGFNEADGVILARLSYIPFDGVINQDFADFVTVADAAKALLSIPDIKNMVLLKDDVRLLEALSESERFRGMIISGYVNQIETEAQTQFSAITVRLSDDEYYISFRGTDHTLVGWKEDFNMGFACPVPSQKLAVEYLQNAAKRTRGRLVIGGHSKGGNLAVYAAAFCDDSVKRRIESVYNFDGPGFDNKVLSSDGYKSIFSKINTFVPQSSVVGMLLGHEEKYTIVHSSQNGIWQHDIYSWEIRRDGFVYLETVDNSSRFVDYTLKAWIAELDYKQREKFVDTIYSVMATTNATTFRELGDHWLANAKTVLTSYKNLDEPTRKAVTQALRSLAKCAKDGLFEMIRGR
ncbi:MAG: DUF2974 domain-containing protein [Acutalibacteraceae bacterium]